MVLHTVDQLDQPDCSHIGRLSFRDNATLFHNHDVIGVATGGGQISDYLTSAALSLISRLTHIPAHREHPFRTNLKPIQVLVSFCMANCSRSPVKYGLYMSQCYYQ